jgi:hypothetical protein
MVEWRLGGILQHNTKLASSDGERKLKAGFAFRPKGARMRLCSEPVEELLHRPTDVRELGVAGAGSAVPAFTPDGRIG